MFLYLLLILKDINSFTLIEKAKLSLSQGKYSDALSIYDQAIIENGQNHLAFFLRGSLNELLRRFTQSVNDYTKAIEIKPDFHKARLNKGIVLTKLGMFDAARIDFTFISQLTDSEFKMESTQRLSILDDLKSKIEQMDAFIKNKAYNEALTVSEDLITHATYYTVIRRARVEIFDNLKDSDMLISELSFLSRMDPNDIELALKISNLYFISGNIEEANGHVKKCLLNDPENKECKQYFKKLKVIRKALGIIEAKIKENAWKETIPLSNALIVDCQDSQFFKAKAHGFLCQSYYKLKDYENSLSHCSAALKVHSKDKELHHIKADIYILKDMFDDAKAEYNEILNIDSEDKRATEGLSKVEKLIKNKNRRNYYQILEVPKTATKLQIEKSYRKLVKKWHPDHFREEEKIKEANKKFQDLNDARMVLTDEEKRQQFDSGIDPLDPEQTSGGGHGQGGHPHFQFHSGGGGSFFNFFNGGNFFGGRGPF